MFEEIKDGEMTASGAGKKDAANKIFYGDSSEVTPVGHLDYSDFSKCTKRDQELEGFDPKYRDFVDYILKITHNIWEEKGIGIIYDTYHNNVIMHAGTQNIVGIKEVISGTMQTLHAFPDRRLIGQDVIWSKIEENSYLSSHRIISTATNLGDSSFGPATGKRINFRTVVDCAVSNNRVYEEWLVRDNLWIAMQLGCDPHELAKKASKQPAKEKGFQSNYGLPEAMEGQFAPKVHVAADSTVGEIMLEMATRIYNYKLFNEVTKYYWDNAVSHFICNKDLNGYDEIQGMLISLFASVPNGSYEVERITCNERKAKNEYDVAIRWRIRGINEGLGYFGKPSNQFIEILGINHYYVVNNKIKEEWMTFDGLDVLRQMYAGCNDTD